MLATGGSVIVLQAVYALVNVIIVFGAMKMYRLSSYGFARLATVLMMIPFSCVASRLVIVDLWCCLPMWLVDLAAGVWALAVLSDALVRLAFPP